MNMEKVKHFLQNRLKNRMLWVAIIALLGNMALSGVIVLPANFEEMATAFLNVLVLLGVFNNPSTKSQSIFVDEDGNGIDDRYENNNDEESLG